MGPTRTLVTVRVCDLGAAMGGRGGLSPPVFPGHRLHVSIPVVYIPSFLPIYYFLS